MLTLMILKYYDVTKTGNKVMEFDYDDVISGERLEMNIILKAGDTIIVP